MPELDWLTARPIAHRGYHDRAAGRIENTLPAAEAAIAHDFAIECDLQPTADGRVVVFHDDTLDRLTEAQGPVADAHARRTARRPPARQRCRHPDAGGTARPGRRAGAAGHRAEEPVGRRPAAGTGGGADPGRLFRAGRGHVVRSACRCVAMRRLAPSLPRGMIADEFRRGRRGPPALADALRAPPPARRGDRVAAFRLLRHRCAARQRAADAAP